MDVSVIIPVYNTALYIEKAVHSALMQEEVKEVIIIDDGSTDGSREICTKLADTDQRIHVLKHPNRANLGPGASRNMGIRQAKYNYISFLDADDFFVENRFVTTKAVFQKHTDVDGVYEMMDMYYYSPVAREKFEHFYSYTAYRLSPPEHPKEIFEHYALNKNGMISICGLTVKREFLLQNDIRFLEEIRMSEDTHFLFSALLKGLFYPGRINHAVVKRGVHTQNSIYNKQLQFISRIYFHHLWFKKMLESNFSKELNWHFFKLKLHYNKIIFPVKEVRWIRYLLKAVLLPYYFIAYPSLISKLF